MKKLMCFIFVIISVSSFANANEFIYHCPYIHDLKYERGYFSALTNYGTPVQWYSVKGFPEKKLTANFLSVNRSDCLGGICQVDCAYKLSNGAFIFLFIVNNQYESIDIVPGHWELNDSTCIDSNPDNCKFYLSSHYNVP